MLKLQLWNVNKRQPAGVHTCLVEKLRYDEHPLPNIGVTWNQYFRNDIGCQWAQAQMMVLATPITDTGCILNS